MKWRGLSPLTDREQDDLRQIIADTNGNRAQRRAAKRLGIIASATDLPIPVDQQGAEQA